MPKPKNTDKPVRKIKSTHAPLNSPTGSISPAVQAISNVESVTSANSNMSWSEVSNNSVNELSKGMVSTGISWIAERVLNKTMVAHQFSEPSIKTANMISQLLVNLGVAATYGAEKSDVITTIATSMAETAAYYATQKGYVTPEQQAEFISTFSKAILVYTAATTISISTGGVALFAATSLSSAFGSELVEAAKEHGTKFEILKHAAVNTATNVVKGASETWNTAKKMGSFGIFAGKKIVENAKDLIDHLPKPSR